MDLPKHDSPHLHLVVATPEELLAQQNANSTEWRGTLSLEAYLRREEHLLDLPLTRNGGLTAWMLVYAPSDSDSRRVICGCESIKKKALIAKDGKLEDGVAHGVASVFCPPKFRGRGYAGRMIEEVGKRLEGWQVEEGERSAFSVLFSDIGKTFYARHEWQPFPSAHIALPAQSTEQERGMPAVRLLKDSDLAELCKADEKLMRSNLARSSTSSGRSTVALVPDPATFQWHAAREDFVNGELHLCQGSLQDRRGVIAGDDPGSRVWCYWTRLWTKPQDEAPSTLHITRLVIEDEGNPAKVDAIAALLRAAQSEAKASGMDEVQLWNPSQTMVAAARQLAPNVEMVHREKASIASLRWYGEGSWENVDWAYNEKYGWC
ncbi:hypothetical protein LTR91_024972 [Friedmanniomyces endolithicus]|uniref:LYC1 C-terminal domain-containing protein n=1 Tax=Friedmanniomyces endolithicus TaxID=329885 RepID=A0AAN6H034_9PEZI|nr:hypothetical protein LTR57_014562 [Friedmanniomyces endolithicus]KAK0951462.1 hypothetical protein LTR91_024972 [Friedmanniomyces endolithicus]KAK0979037.1 hypothetical protein LTS01_012559 [Friedmanniomyces endolithicus]KAK1033588.1 hypothetical protein LTS16_016146 [Friedmanniomyces endolithicus]